MMTSIQRAEDLATEIQHHLDDAALGHPVTAIYDMNRADPVLSAGASLVAVLPPKQTFKTLAITENEWTLLLVAGPVDDHLAAWSKIDRITLALRDPLNIETADPAEYQMKAGPAYPAYTLTFTEDI